MTPRATSSGTEENMNNVSLGRAMKSKTPKSHVVAKPTDWLPFQEVDVVKHLPLLGSQIVQPVLYDALALLKT